VRKTPFALAVLLVLVIPCVAYAQKPAQPPGLAKKEAQSAAPATQPPPAHLQPGVKQPPGQAKKEAKSAAPATPPAKSPPTKAPAPSKSGARKAAKAKAKAKTASAPKDKSGAPKAKPKTKPKPDRDPFGDGGGKKGSNGTYQTNGHYAVGAVQG
jgi:type IV secretory pathway VirB10-like protein